jgi:antitoxin (DNA-binding transcriptional repressor) of toxin-antitoxin stability system
LKQIGATELARKTSEIMRRVRENHETFDVTYRGRVVAVLAPCVRPADYLSKEEREEDWRKVWAQMDETAAEISKHWPKDVSAVDAVREQRRNLTPDEWVVPKDRR